MRLLVLAVSFLLAVLSPRSSLAEFLQQDRLRDASEDALKSLEVRGLAADARGRIVAGTSGGLFREEGGVWKRLAEGTFGRVRVGADKDLYAASGGLIYQVDDAGEARRVLDHGSKEIHDFAVDVRGRFLVVGPLVERDSVDWQRDSVLEPRDNVAIYLSDGDLVHPKLPSPHVYGWSAASGADGAFWFAAKQGLFSLDGTGFHRWAPPDGQLWLLGERMDGLHVARDGSVWYANDLGVIRLDPKASAWTGMRPETHGVPFPYAKAIAEEADGTIWIGGSIGAAKRSPAGRWTYYQGQAWLPHDQVLSIAAAPGGRVYVGTEAGLGVIESRPMTLAKKAEHFDELAPRHHTNRYGFVWSVHCTTAGDASTALESSYSDNDGLWTAAYLGSQCLRYAATKSEEALKNARRSMEGILMLEEVTGIPGYPARSYAIAANHTGNAWFDSWHRSPDGKHLWKGDTSSDEAVGHYFAHSLYFDHVATEPEKARMRERIAAMTDHIIEHGLAFVERKDGEPTRWGVWSPERCFEWGHYWYSSRLWALCILSHLKVAYHVTGEARFEKEYRRLISENDYARRTLGQKITIGHINHSDDQMAILSYYPLLLYEKDPDLRATYLESLLQSWEIERPEASPLWNFIYNWAASNRADLDRSIDHLERVPWMMFTWTHDNSRRWDLPLKPFLRGEAESARALSMDERGPYGFTSNPYTLQSGNGGRELESPTVYLLPYWLGRVHGFVGEGE